MGTRVELALSVACNQWFAHTPCKCKSSPLCIGSWLLLVVNAMAPWVPRTVLFPSLCMGG